MKVFLSYRRGDASGHAGRLHDDLIDRLGPGSVFQDVASIAPGQRFLQAIDESINESDVVFVVIGRHWTGFGDEGQGHRLTNEDDVVRREVEAALRSGRRVVPVLVDRARLPSDDVLPPTLAPLLELNAIELRDEAWAQDLERLYAAIGVSPRRSKRPGWLVPATVAVAAVLLIAAALMIRQQLAGTDMQSATSDGSGSAVPTPSQAPQPQPSPPSVATAMPDLSGEVVWTVQRWWQEPGPGDGTTVTAEVKVTNNTNDTITVYRELFALRAAQVDQGVPDLVITAGPSDGTPMAGEAVIAMVRFSRVWDTTPLVLRVGADLDTKEVVLRE